MAAITVVMNATHNNFKMEPDRLRFTLSEFQTLTALKKRPPLRKTVKSNKTHQLALQLINRTNTVLSQSKSNDVVCITYHKTVSRDRFYIIGYRDFFKATLSAPRCQSFEL